MTALVDTNVLVYRFDPRDSAKQRVARELLREGIARVPFDSSAGVAAPTEPDCRIQDIENRPCRLSSKHDNATFLGEWVLRNAGYAQRAY